MRTGLISIATDTLPLDGALYLPEAEPSGAVMLFHGNTMNFYVGAPRFLPPVLTRLGFACLAFNRRGHDILSIRDSRAAEGAAFQLTKEGIEDNNYAARWLAERGFSRPVVIGHSNGGMLAVKHVSDHPETPAMVLLSAHGGGRDGVQRTSRAERPPRRDNRPGTRPRSCRPGPRADVGTRMVVRHKRRELSRPHDRDARCLGARADDPLPNALHPRRRGERGNLSS